MSTPTTKESLAQADIILNRTNVALARSQRLIASWLPPQTSAQQNDANDDDDEDFRGDSEIGGIGSAAQRDDSGLPERRKLGANDRLLESLLGKRAAGAHRKGQQQGGRGSSGGLAQGASKPLVREPPKRKPVDEDSDEEEGGRAAAFTSRKVKPVKQTAQVRVTGADEDAVPGAEAEDLAERTVHTLPKPAACQPTPSAVGKKRPASYLDELLAHKASKKSKKKKSKTAATAQEA